MQSHVMVRVAWLTLVVLLLPAAGYAKKLKFKTCGQSLPLQLKPFTNKPQRIDFLCGNTGCHKSP
ncbi:MAG TPA: hypothetical protein VII34_09365, partial [Pyrinomonadaceae bacterium]